MKHIVPLSILSAMAGVILALSGCEDSPSEKKIKSTTQVLDDQTNYRKVCLGGVQYYMSRVVTYSGQFGASDPQWVIGGAVIDPQLSSGSVMRCDE